MQRVVSSWSVASCLDFADFLFPSISIVNGGDHQGGTGCGLIFSIGAAWLGNVLARCSRGVIKVLLCEDVARRMAKLMGCVSGAVCILVQDCRARFLRRRLVGGTDVSICNAENAVVRKVPTMAFIAVLCADSSFAIDFCLGGAALLLKGLYQTIAVYSIHGAATEVNRVQVCWYAGPLVQLAILEIASANCVPLFAACWVCCWEESLRSNITPRYLASSAGLIVISPTRTCAASVIFGDAVFLKWTRTYFTCFK